MMTDDQIEVLLSRLRDELKQRFPSDKPPKTISDIERYALDAQQLMGELLAEELVNGSADTSEETRQAADAPSVECRCGRRARFKGMRSREVVMMSGHVQVSRRYYYCKRCRQGFCPADRPLQLTESRFTPLVEEAVAQMCCLLPYEAAVQLLTRLTGVRVSASYAQTITDQAGVAADLLYAQERAVSELQETGVTSSPAILYLLADGVQTPVKGGWRETKVGLAFTLDARGRRTSKRYVSHLGHAEAFGDQWYATAVQAGLHNAKLCVVLGDGSHWIWTQTSINFPYAIQILDYWHALDRLWNVARAVFGEGTQEAASWVGQGRACMDNGDVDGLLNLLKKAPQTTPEAKSKIQEALTYYHNNRERMNYKLYRTMGLSIGSGAIESGCKQVVTQRLKGAGMRWTEVTAQAIGRLKCILLSQDWDRVVPQWNTLRMQTA